MEEAVQEGGQSLSLVGRESRGLSSANPAPGAPLLQSSGPTWTPVSICQYAIKQVHLSRGERSLLT